MPSDTHQKASAANARPRVDPSPSMSPLPQVESGLEVAQRYLAGSPAAVARQTLTDSFLRRLQKLTDEDLFASEEY